MIAYKLLRQRKDGTLGPLFFNRSQRIPLRKWLWAETGIHLKGFKYRPGWHAVLRPEAPHLSTKGRVWCKVEVRFAKTYDVPANHGSNWVLARRLRILEVMSI